MRLPILTAAAFLLLGTSASMYARQEKGPDDHSQEAKPAKQEAKPAEQAKPAERQQTAKPEPQAQAKPEQQPKAKPAERQQTQSAKPAQQQHTQQAATPKQQPAKTASRTEQGNAGTTQARTQQSRTVSANSGASEHGRISNAHYTASFGSGHSFHVNQGDYAHRRFQYGGYSFGFVDAWPIGWGYSDDVYVVYADGGYYMYDRVHPGLRISLSIL
jgi:outer membrane biosynthesis protein TonB